MSVAFLESVPQSMARKAPTSAMRSRSVCQAISGVAKFNVLASSSWHSSGSRPLSPLTSVASVPAAPRKLERENAFSELSKTLLMAL